MSFEKMMEWILLGRAAACYCLCWVFIVKSREEAVRGLVKIHVCSLIDDSFAVYYAASSIEERKANGPPDVSFG